MNTLFRLTTATLLVSLLAPLSQAVPITGQVDFAGGVTLNTTSLATATQVSSFNAVTVAMPVGVTAGSILDIFINPGDVVTMTSPWVFGAGKAALWTVGGFTFDLTSSAIVTQTSTFLNVTGFGTLSGNGYDPTPGLWAFTSQNLLGGENTTFSFSSSTAAVPEGGTTAALLGFALLGIGLAARRTRRA